MPELPPGDLRDAILREEALKMKRDLVRAWIFCTVFSLPVACSAVTGGAASNAGMVFPSGGIIAVAGFYLLSFVVSVGLQIHFSEAIRGNRSLIVRLSHHEKSG